ncbi:hypothetical protein GJ744_001458 [Endocarpon pusillum]|uniref:Uncharacterized protein n=1 Tax=Endocarpon pusillum TaxID=364733 RepID=A0A8H7ANV8_9EURO|nr:hypothetical protein GJ744_001458 [Endocarpon pusillum]
MEKVVGEIWLGGFGRKGIKDGFGGAGGGAVFYFTCPLNADNPTLHEPDQPLSPSIALPVFGQ